MLKNWTKFVCVLAILAGACNTNCAVAQDADKVEKSKKATAQTNTFVLRKSQDGQQKVEEKKIIVGGNGNRIKVKGNQIVITDANGESKTIDISGAASIQVEQSVQTTNKNGKQKAAFQGQAIVIGPDGKKEVIKLDGPMDGVLMKDGFKGLADNVFRFEVDGEGVKRRLPGTLRWTMGKPSKFMIGVHCEAVSDALRAQLQLDSGVGLMVKMVTKDSPAEKAGVQQYDILLHVGDTDLKDVKTLSEHVEKAGNDKKKLNITGIRKGKEVTLTVSPVERPAQEGQPMQIQVEEMGPGIVIPDRLKGLNIQGNFGNEFKEMREEMQRIRKELNELRRNRFKRD